MMSITHQQYSLERAISFSPKTLVENRSQVDHKARTGKTIDGMNQNKTTGQPTIEGPESSIQDECQA